MIAEMLMGGFCDWTSVERQALLFNGPASWAAARLGCDSGLASVQGTGIVLVPYTEGGHYGKSAEEERRS